MHFCVSSAWRFVWRFFFLYEECFTVSNNVHQAFNFRRFKNLFMVSARFCEIYFILLVLLYTFIILMWLTQLVWCKTAKVIWYCSSRNFAGVDISDNKKLVLTYDLLLVWCRFRVGIRFCMNIHCQAIVPRANVVQSMLKWSFKIQHIGKCKGLKNLFAVRPHFY